MFLFIIIVFTIATITLNISNGLFDTQLKPLNVIALGQRETYNINQMITKTVIFTKYVFNVMLNMIAMKYDHNKWMITFTVITLSSW